MSSHLFVKLDMTNYCQGLDHFSSWLFLWALRQIGLMSNICQVIIRLPGFLYTLFHYSFSSLYYAFRAALRLLVLPVFHLDIACSSLIF